MTIHVHNAVSRRTLLTGLAGAGALAASAGRADAAPVAFFEPLGGPLAPAAIDPAITGLTYATLDAAAFMPATGGRYCDDTSGAGPLSPPGTLLASLPVPTGSVIRQVNIAYQGTPAFSLVGRSMTNPQGATSSLLSATLAAGGGPKTQTLTGSIAAAANTTHSLRFVCQPGDSVYGVTVGYVPPVQGFVPFTGTPRVLDTRSTGGKFAPGEERTVELGAPGVRGAVLNVTLTGTEGVGGYLAVFPANVSWPGNSSINWFGADQNLANSVTTAVDGSGRITVRAGDNATHVIIDRVGWLV